MNSHDFGDLNDVRQDAVLRTKRAGDAELRARAWLDRLNTGAALSEEEKRDANDELQRMRSGLKNDQEMTRRAEEDLVSRLEDLSGSREKSVRDVLTAIRAGERETAHAADVVIKALTAIERT